MVVEQLVAVKIAPRDILIEPSARNTAAAICAAAVALAAKDGDSLMLVAPSDHVIPDADGFRATVQAAAPTALNGQIVTFGIRANRAETGYGWLELSYKPSDDFAPVAQPLSSFVEKPNADTPRREVALRLAIAEARYHRALDKLQTHAVEQNSAQVRADEFQCIMRQEIASLVHEGRDGRPNLTALEYASSALRRTERLSRDGERERRLYRRYLGEARAQRRKALRAWCALNSEEKRNSRNELKSHEWAGT